MDEQERLAEEGGRAPQRIGDQAVRVNAAARAQKAEQRHQQRHRRDDPRDRRQHERERTWLSRGCLCEPLDAFLDHVPLKPVQPGPVGRQDSTLDGDAAAGRHRSTQFGPDPVVEWDVPSGTKRQFSWNQPQPVIGEVDARRVPPSGAGVDERQRNGEFI